jgi:hypothetical protein
MHLERRSLFRLPTKLGGLAVPKRMLNILVFVWPRDARQFECVASNAAQDDTHRYGPRLFNAASSSSICTARIMSLLSHNASTYVERERFFLL